MRLLSLLTLILTVLTAPALAKTPEEAVLDYFALIKEKGIVNIAEMMHPEELSKFREALTPAIKKGLAGKLKKTTAEDKSLFEKFADPKDKTKMRAMADVEFMTLFLEAVASMVPGLADMMKAAEVRALGHVKEKDISHVVVRTKMKIEKVEVEAVNVISVKDHNGVPMMLMTAEMKGIADIIGQLSGEEAD